MKDQQVRQASDTQVESKQGYNYPLCIIIILLTLSSVSWMIFDMYGRNTNLEHSFALPNGSRFSIEPLSENSKGEFLEGFHKNFSLTTNNSGSFFSEEDAFLFALLEYAKKFTKKHPLEKKFVLRVEGMNESGGSIATIRINENEKGNSITFSR